MSRYWSRLVMRVGLAVALVNFIASYLSAQSPGDEEVVELRVGISLGYSHHISKTYDVDAVSGATRSVNGTDFSKPSGAAGIFLDAGFWKFGPGVVGGMLVAQMSAPDVFYAVSLYPRYRLSFDIDGRWASSVAPWIGGGLTMQWVIFFATSLISHLLLRKWHESATRRER